MHLGKDFAEFPAIPVNMFLRRHVVFGFPVIEIGDESLEEPGHLSLIAEEVSESKLSRLLIREKIIMDQFAKMHEEPVVSIVPM